MSFKSKNTFNNRVSESRRILNNYPDRIPVICERSVVSNDCPLIDKNKYLVPNELKIGEFIYVIRKRMKMQQDKALFIFINKQILSLQYNILDIYNLYKNDDGFLYITYSLEDTFGK